MAIPPDYSFEKYGSNPEGLLSSPEEVRGRLEAILNDRLLRFNPYVADDASLLACAERAYWLPWPSLTQMVVFHFHDVRWVKWKVPYEAIFYHIGNDRQERHMSLGVLTRYESYTATRRQIHVTVNGRPLTNGGMVERMQGKDYFISHALPTCKYGGPVRPAYRMHCLRGSDSRKAETVRTAMVDSKIVMLREILAYPFTSQYLRCSRDFIDYTTPIMAAISEIERFRDFRLN